MFYKKKGDRDIHIYRYIYSHVSTIKYSKVYQYTKCIIAYIEICYLCSTINTLFVRTFMCGKGKFMANKYYQPDNNKTADNGDNNIYCVGEGCCCVTHYIEKSIIYSIRVLKRQFYLPHYTQYRKISVSGHLSKKFRWLRKMLFSSFSCSIRKVDIDHYIFRFCIL